MAKGQQRSNREAKKPKKKKIKVIAAAPSQKGAGWQPTFAEGKTIRIITRDGKEFIATRAEAEHDELEAAPVF